MIYERSTLVKTIKIRVTSLPDNRVWYADHVGSVFTVRDFSSSHYNLDAYSMASGSPYLIRKTDVVIVN